MSKIIFNEQEREKIILDNLWIVQYLAKKYSNGKQNLYEELKSVGNIGLVKAVDNYDDSMGTTFSTYATLLVQGEIRHYLRDNTDVIRIPRKYISYFKMIQNAINHFMNQKGKVPTIHELIDLTG